MDLVWAIAFHIKPIMVLPSSSYNSFVLYYGIATYLAAHHSYPIRSSMGMIWLSPIPIPHDVWPSTMGMLRIWQYSTQFPYHPGTLVYDMGMIWESGKVPYNSHIIQACWPMTWEWYGKLPYNLHIICRYAASDTEMIWFFTQFLSNPVFSVNSCDASYYWTTFSQFTSQFSEVIASLINVLINYSK